jgi:hypothetical protein
MSLRPRGRLLVAVPSFGRFLGCLCFFDGDLSVFGDGENGSLLLLPSRQQLRVRSSAKDDYGFLFVSSCSS